MLNKSKIYKLEDKYLKQKTGNICFHSKCCLFSIADKVYAFLFDLIDKKYFNIVELSKQTERFAEKCIIDFMLF